ncbi:MAG: PAS domain S-box protein [Planctomycetota bacterium]
MRVALSAADSLEEAMPSVLGAIGEALGWQRGEFWAHHPEQGLLRCAASWRHEDFDGRALELAAQRLSVELEVGLLGRAWAAGHAIGVEDVQLDPGFLRRAAATRDGIHGAYACPLATEGGPGAPCMGAVAFFSERTASLDPDTLAWLSALCGEIAQFAERRRAERQAREATAQFELAFRCAATGMAISDLEGRILHANDAICEFFGRSREELVGLGMADVTHPEDLEASRAVIHGLLAGEASAMVLEKRYLHSSGRTVWGHISASLIRDEAGQPRHFVVLVEDRSADKAGEALREGESQLLEAMALGVPLPELLDQLALLIEAQAPGMLCTVLLLGEDGVHIRHGAGPSLPPTYLEAVDGAPIGPVAGSCGTAMYRRERVIVKDIRTDPLWAAYQGLPLPRELRACWSTPILARDGTVLGSFAMYYAEARGPTPAEAGLLDIATHLASIAIERARVDETLRASEERFRTVVTRMTEGLAVTDARGVIVLANDTLCRMVGASRDELEGEPLASLAATPEDEALLVREEAARCGCGAERQEVLLRGPHGATVQAMVSAGPFLDAAGEAVGCIRVVADVTARRELEARLRQAQKMEAVGRLAGGVAHDFNNVLTAILSYTELLLHPSQPTAGWRASVSEIRAAGRRAAELTRQLLAFSRQQVVQPRLLDVSRAVAGIEPMLRRLIGEDVELIVDLEPSAGCVLADPSQVEQVLVNLVLNARDAMPRGGRLLVRTRRGAATEVPELGEHVLLLVSDTGVGMDEQTRAQIFEPFFSTKEVGQGTGLGLSTVYGIVEQAGGRIAVESTPGRGSVFEVRLPRAEGEVRAEPAAAAQPAHRGHGTILLVEDDPSVRKVSRALLEQLGYSVIPAASPEAAIAEATRLEGRVDLVVTDLVMPGMNGRELADRLVASWPETRVIFMSGYAGDTLARRELRPGVTYLAKPFTFEELTAKVREALEG